jgi:hypothetical protein
MDRKPSPEYSRVFTAAAVGLFLLVTGSIGFEVRGMHGAFAGGRWSDPPIWWQVALGTAALLASMRWARSLVTRTL